MRAQTTLELGWASAMSRKPPSRLRIDIGSWLLLATVIVAFWAFAWVIWE